MMKKKILAMICIGVFTIGTLAGCGSAGSDQANKQSTDTASQTEGENTADDSVGEAELTVTISINCSTVLDNMDKLDPTKEEFVPEDGWILEPTEVAIEAGDSVYDVLLEVCQDNKISMEHNTTPGYQSEYIEGIGQLYEFDCGELSGWHFAVDGETQNYGSDKITLEGGEVIEWLYTCDLGRDIGAGEE